MRRKYRGLRAHGLDRISAIALGALSCLVGQPEDVVCVLNLKLEV